MIKKFTVAVAVAGAFAAAGASAATLGQYDRGCLVPSAIFDGSSDTVVGLTTLNFDNTAANAAQHIHWTFFDRDSNHIADGTLAATSRDLVSFSLRNPDLNAVASANSGSRSATSGVQGYLVFSPEMTTAGTLSTTMASLACNAFYVTANDAAFIPAVPLAASDYSTGALTGLASMGPTSLLTLMNGSGYLRGANHLGVPVTATALELRYWIDGATGGRDTKMVFWTTNNARVAHGGGASSAAPGSATVQIYNDAQAYASGNYAMLWSELNIVDPEAMSGRPSSYLDGFVEYSLTQGSIVSGVFVYSVVSDPAFGATQTLMGSAY